MEILLDNAYAKKDILTIIKIALANNAKIYGNYLL